MTINKNLSSDKKFSKEKSKQIRDNNEVHLTVSGLFNLTNRLSEIFQSSNTKEKN